MTGHGGVVVIHQDHDAAAVVVDHVGQCGQTGMPEGTVTDGAHAVLGQVGKAHAVQLADGSAHAAHGVLGLEGRLGTQVVAADIAGAGDVMLLEDIVSASVGAAGAQNGVTAGQVLHFLDIVGTGILIQDAVLQTDVQQTIGQQLIASGEQLLTYAVNTHGLDLLFDNGIQLLDDVDLVHLGGEVLDHVLGQRIAHAQLQDGSIGEHILDVGIHNAGADNAHLGIAHLDAVDAAGLDVVGDLLDVLLDAGVHDAGIHGGAVILGQVAGELLQHLGIFGALAQLHHALAVRNTHDAVDQTGGVELLGHFESQLHIVLGFLAVAGFKGGDLCQTGIPAVILLILGAEQTGVIGSDQHQTSLGAGVHGVQQGIHQHVHTDLLGGHQSALAAVSSTGSGVHGHLLIGGPLDVHFVAILGSHVLDDLRAGGSGITRDDLHACFVCAACNGFVTGK